MVARSGAEDVDAAVDAAQRGPARLGAARPSAERGAILRRIAQLLERDADEVAAIVAAETGKSPKEARGRGRRRDRAGLLRRRARADASTAGPRPARSRTARR